MFIEELVGENLRGFMFFRGVILEYFNFFFVNDEFFVNLVVFRGCFIQLGTCVQVFSSEGVSLEFEEMIDIIEVVNKFYFMKEF